MKRAFFLSIVILLFIAGCKQEAANPIEGAWNLIYAKNVVNDTVTSSFPADYKGSDIKMWSDNYFMFVGKFTRDTITMDNFGGGTYTLDGIVYKETILYHAAPDYVGQTVGMRIVVENDTLIQTWPADENGEVDKHNYRCEKYVKAK